MWSICSFCRTFGDENLGVAAGTFGFSLPAMPWSDWEINSSEIQLCKRPNGADWELGSGSFGKVRPNLSYLSDHWHIRLSHSVEHSLREIGSEILSGSSSSASLLFGSGVQGHALVESACRCQDPA